LIYCKVHKEGNVFKCSPEVPSTGAGMVFCKIAHTETEKCNRCNGLLKLGQQFGHEMTLKGVRPFHRNKNDCSK
jgi:hypothetical protein